MRLLAAIVLATAAPLLVAQQSGQGGMTGGGGGMSGGNSQSSSPGGNGSQRPSGDDISAVAPPFDVEDILRMHRVGLQDEVIIQALRARYHRIILSAADRELLTKNSVSPTVISAMEDPLGTGVHPNGEAAIAPASVPFAENTPATPADATPQPPNQSVSMTQTDSVASHEGSHAQPQNPSTVAAPAAGAHNEAQKAASSTEIASVPTFPASGTMRLPVPNPGADSASVKPISIEGAPKAPGIYCHLSKGGWAQVSMETVSWKHSEEDPTRNVEGRLYGAVSPTSTSATNADLLIVTPPNVSVIQYQLLKIRSNHTARDFHPEQGGNVVGEAKKSEVLGYNPERLGPNAWLLSLHDLPQGDYGLLPPVQSGLHSATGFAKTIYTFHVL
jgi:hypothetical protein